MRLLIPALLAACEPVVEPDSAACDPGDTTWDSWGAGFFASYCLSCHSASTPDRRGAPVGMDFDSEAQVLTNLDGIERSVLTDVTMPRGGGVPEAELERLRTYIACGDGGDAYVAPVLLPVATVSEVEADLDMVLEQGVFLPFDLHLWFEDLLNEAEGDDRSCPHRVRAPDEESNWTMFWSGTCVTPRREFVGDTISYVEVERGVETHVQIWDLFSLTGTDLATGAPIVAGGNTLFTWFVSGAAAQFNTFWGGRYHDPSSAGPFAGEQSAGLKLDGMYSGRDGLAATVSGGLAVGGATVDFRDVVFTAGCAGPSGVIGVRDPGGGWWTLTLPDDCSGCGPLSFEGTAHGSSCAGLALAERLEADVLAAMVDFP